VDGLIARLPELDALGVGVVLVGSGPPAALAAFGRDMALARRGVTMVTDPSLTAFRAAELRRPRFHGLRAAVEALRELAAGYAPGRVIGDARQLGGAFFVDESGRVIYHPREFQRLLAVGRWQEAPAKAVLIDQGASPGRMLVLASGRTAVKVDGREVATPRLGQFAGEMSFLTGARTAAAVELVEPARFVSWATDDLERFLGKHPELRAALQLVLGRG